MAFAAAPECSSAHALIWVAVHPHQACALRSNGEAGFFVEMALHEWVWARSHDRSGPGSVHLPGGLYHYKGHGSHASLDYKPPVRRVVLPLNNAPGVHGWPIVFATPANDV